MNFPGIIHEMGASAYAFVAGIILVLAFLAFHFFRNEHFWRKVVLFFSIVVVAVSLLLMVLWINKSFQASGLGTASPSPIPDSAAISKKPPAIVPPIPDGDKQGPTRSTKKVNPDKPKNETQEKPGNTNVSPPQPQTQIVSAPNGIANGSGTLVNPQVNNVYGARRPPPKVNWGVTPDAKICSDDGAQWRAVEIDVEGIFTEPAFRLRCSSYCQIGTVFVARIGPGVFSSHNIDRDLRRMQDGSLDLYLPDLASLSPSSSLIVCFLNDGGGITSVEAVVQ